MASKVIQWLELPAFTAKDMGSIFGQVNMIQQVHPKKKKKKGKVGDGGSAAHGRGTESHQFEVLSVTSQTQGLG